MWARPARGRFTSGFGPRMAPKPGASTFHRGVDIAPPKSGQSGVDVVAASAGEVVAVGTSTVRGIWVVVRHQDGTATRSQHLASRAVALKQKVAAGAVLGEMGATGLAAGIHLHYETFPAGADWTTSANAVDPEPFMADRGVDLRVDTDPTTPTPAPRRSPDMLVIRGIEKPEVYVYNGAAKRHLPTQAAVNEHLEALGQTAPVVWGQFNVDRIPDLAATGTALIDPATVSAAAEAGARTALADLTLRAS